MIKRKEFPFDITAVGEILIDFTESGVSAGGNPLYEANAGGAPANVAAAAAKLGSKTAFIGATGTDRFGVLLRRALEACGTDTSGMQSAAHRHTTLAFVSLGEGGERQFSFCRNPGADTAFSIDGPVAALVSGSRFLHVGSLSLTEEPARSSTFTAVAEAKRSGGFVSYDPNWREALWPSLQAGLEAMRSLLPYADVVKVSESELTLLTGAAPDPAGLSRGAAALLEHGARLVCVTLGARGAFYKTAAWEGLVPVPPYPVPVVDTTGAGDAFTGALLHRLAARLRNRCDDGCFLPETAAELEADLAFANAAASLCVTKRGAIPAAPDGAAVSRFLGTGAV